MLVLHHISNAINKNTTTFHIWKQYVDWKCMEWNYEEWEIDTRTLIGRRHDISLITIYLVLRTYICYIRMR